MGEADDVARAVEIPIPYDLGLMLRYTMADGCQLDEAKSSGAEIFIASCRGHDGSTRFCSRLKRYRLIRCGLPPSNTALLSIVLLERPVFES